MAKATIVDGLKDFAQHMWPTHGNNSEAKRAEQPQESKDQKKDKPSNMPRVEQALKDAGA